MTTATAPKRGTHGSGPMPEVADYEAAWQKLVAGSTAIEDIRIRVERQLEDTAPTFADVGSLWSFITSVESSATCVTNDAEALKQLLEDLDSRRLDLLVVTTGPLNRRS